MWPAILNRARAVIRQKMQDCRVVLDPDGAAHACPGIFHAPHEEMVADGEGGVAVCSTDPVVDIDLDQLPVVPKTKDVLTVEARLPDGGFAAPVRYRVKDTQDDGYGSVKLRLVKGGS